MLIEEAKGGQHVIDYQASVSFEQKNTSRSNKQFKTSPKAQGHLSISKSDRDDDRRQPTLTPRNYLHQLMIHMVGME